MNDLLTATYLHETNWMDVPDYVFASSSSFLSSASFFLCHRHAAFVFCVSSRLTRRRQRWSLTPGDLEYHQVYVCASYAYASSSEPLDSLNDTARVTKIVKRVNIIKTIDKSSS